ncbi:hypothetical protein M413DRAFT_14454 [Hebeloma cylindrosporum]|uniref:Uncharacterized protein n=1 Tax=Hebeloma cylindrosporum TaxID=76867 RepID=A0A0C3BU85_HEBCY|nr:hypothetical protein M413DRAFT_14454 [Hebeloma cylindrosporum h7]
MSNAGRRNLFVTYSKAIRAAQTTQNDLKPSCTRTLSPTTSPASLMIKPTRNECPSLRLARLPCEAYQIWINAVDFIVSVYVYTVQRGLVEKEAITSPSVFIFPQGVGLLISELAGTLYEPPKNLRSRFISPPTMTKRRNFSQYMTLSLWRLVDPEAAIPISTRVAQTYQHRLGHRGIEEELSDFGSPKISQASLASAGRRLSYNLRISATHWDVRGPSYLVGIAHTWPTRKSRGKIPVVAKRGYRRHAEVSTRDVIYEGKVIHFFRSVRYERKSKSIQQQQQQRKDRRYHRREIHIIFSIDHETEKKRE